MSDEPRWRRYLRFHRPNHRADLDDELRDHLQSTIDALVASGMSIEAAHLEAQRRFGDVDSVRDEVVRIDSHEAGTRARLAWLADLRHDAVFALRQLRRAPLFTAIAALSIGLGVALNVTIFSLANGVLLRPLPGVRADGLRRLYANHHGGFQWEDLQWVRERATTLDGVVGERLLPMSMRLGDRPERIVGALATRGFFQSLGVRMALGRAFDVDERDAGQPEAVLSYAAWRARFGADSSVIGRSVRLSDHAFTIVGVAAPEFTSSVFGWAPALWVPLASVSSITGASVDQFGGSFYATARLKNLNGEGVATAELISLGKERLAMDTSRFQQFIPRLGDIRGVNAELRTPAALAAGFLLAMVILVLVIACANVANLLLGRAAARRTEIGVRLALGAGRGRLIRQLLTESLMLASVGGVLGVAAAFGLVRVIAHLIPFDSDVYVDLAPDGQVFAYAAVVCVGSALLFGLAPALRASSPSLTTLLRRDADLAGGRARSRGALVTSQVALCVVLLAVASLLARSFAQSRDVDPGVVASGVLDVQLDVGQNRPAADGRQLYDRLIERLDAVPGVQSTTLAEIAPLSGSNSQNGVLPDGSAVTDRARMPRSYFNVVGPGYFSTLGIRLVRGREFAKTDVEASPRVAVINETFARRLWPNEDALGKRFHWRSADGTLIQVVGVARDGKYNSYGEDQTSFVYLPLLQNYRSMMIAHVRVVSAGVTTAMLRDAVTSVDPSLTAPTVKPLTDEMAIALAPSRIGAMMLGAFGLVALLIAASGIYGVTSYAVSRRTREIGIRAALGASRSMVVTLILREGMRTVAIGAVIGLILGALIGVVLSRVLYGISPLDPAMLLGVPAALSVVAGVACLPPALRATRVDPITAMRSD